MEEVEKIWNNYWKEIVCDRYGDVDMDQVKKELYDYQIVLKEVPKVYCEITNGLLSYPTYKAEDVIHIFREKFVDKDDFVDWLQDNWDEIMIGCKNSEDYKKKLIDYLINW